MTYSCSIYGLGLEVNVPVAGLSGLDPSPRVDVSMTLGTLPPELHGVEESWSPHYVTDGGDERGKPWARVSKRANRHGKYYRIEYADDTVIVVEANGAAIWAQGPDAATIEDTATYLLGPVLGFLLRLRGITCLHASCVALGGKAVAFVGPAGAGKSSTAAAFARLGYPVLTEDVTPLTDLGDRFRVPPAYPRIRLWPDSVESLFGASDALPRITPAWDKRFLDLNRPDVAFKREPLELGAIYMLGERQEGSPVPLVRPLDGRAALMSLIGETYATRMLEPAMRAREFEFLGRLVEAVPIRRLNPSADIAQIAQLCETVERDFEGLQAH